MRLLLLSLTFLLTAPTYAMWICQANNAKGETFNSTHNEKQTAIQNALAMCTNNSSFSWGQSCAINTCRKSTYPSLPERPDDPVKFYPLEFSWAR